jgi:hypothetical protein
MLYINYNSNKYIKVEYTNNDINNMLCGFIL